MDPSAAVSGKTSNGPDFMLSLARGLAVIRAFGDGEGRHSVSDITTRTGLSRATVRRCLHTLEALGYVVGNNGLYEFTPAVVALGYGYLSSTALVRAAQGTLEDVSEQVRESSSMGLLDGDEVIYVARVAVGRVLSIALTVGSRLPWSCTSMGRVLVSHLDEPDRAERLARVRLTAQTPRTITDRSRFRAELDRVRAQGFAIVDEELELGLRSVSVPVFHAGRVVAAVNVGVHVSRASVHVLEREFLPVLRGAATAIESALARAAPAPSPRRRRATASA